MTNLHKLVIGALLLGSAPYAFAATATSTQTSQDSRPQPTDSVVHDDIQRAASKAGTQLENPASRDADKADEAPPGHSRERRAATWQSLLPGSIQ